MAYNLTGVYYNRQRHNLNGLNAVPHIDKWRRVPEQMKYYGHYGFVILANLTQFAID